MHGELPEHFNLASHFLDAPAALHSERAAIVGEPREVSYGELAALANRAGNALRAQGVSRRRPRPDRAAGSGGVGAGFFWRRKDCGPGRAGDPFRAISRL